MLKPKRMTVEAYAEILEYKKRREELDQIFPSLKLAGRKYGCDWRLFTRAKYWRYVPDEAYRDRLAKQKAKAKLPKQKEIAAKHGLTIDDVTWALRVGYATLDRLIVRQNKHRGLQKPVGICADPSRT